MHRRLGLAVGLVSVLCGCGAGRDTPAASSDLPVSSQSEAYDAVPVDWDNPNGGDPIASVAAAAKSLPFAPVVPAELGTPAGMYLSDPGKDYPPDFVELEFVYDTPTFGRVIVIEHHPSVPDAKEYAAYEDEMASLSGTADMHGTAKKVGLADGTVALLEVAPDGAEATINWYVNAPTGDYEVIIQGPKLSDDAVRVANGLVAQTGLNPR